MFRQHLSKSYAINYILGQVNPADNTIYYFGMHPNSGGTTSGRNRISLINPGTIIGCYIGIEVNTILGSSELSTIAIRKNDTTDTTVSAALNLSSAFSSYSSNSLSIAMNGTTDYVELKWTTPTNWVTNPTGVRVVGYIFVN